VDGTGQRLGYSDEFYAGLPMTCRFILCLQLWVPKLMPSGDIRELCRPVHYAELCARGLATGVNGREESGIILAGSSCSSPSDLNRSSFLSSGY